MSHLALVHSWQLNMGTIATFLARVRRLCLRNNIFKILCKNFGIRITFLFFVDIFHWTQDVVVGQLKKDNVFTFL